MDDICSSRVVDEIELDEMNVNVTVCSQVFEYEQAKMFIAI
jgi:hypothetical protein